MVVFEVIGMGTYQSTEKLAESPPDGQDGQQVLMRRRNELCSTTCQCGRTDFPLDNKLPRKTAESTGKFPPVPTLHTATNEHKATALGEPPAAVANRPVMNSVMLNAHLSCAPPYRQYDIQNATSNIRTFVPKYLKQHPR